MATEINTWIEYLSNLLQHKQFDIYLKGGSVLGLNVLKMIIGSDCFDPNIFNNLTLIKDWDFVLYGVDANTADLFNSISTKHNMCREGVTICVYRYGTYSDRMYYGTGAAAEAMIELSAKNKELLSGMEIPLTAMKISVTTHTINNIFKLIAIFIDGISINNLAIISDLLSTIPIIVPDHDIYGLFSGTDSSNYDCGLSAELLKIANQSQFIISQIVEPDRLFVRLYEKNIPKSQRICNYLADFGIGATWLMDINHVCQTIDNFIHQLKLCVNNIYCGLNFADTYKELDIISVHKYLVKNNIDYDKLATYCVTSTDTPCATSTDAPYTPNTDTMCALFELLEICPEYRPIAKFTKSLDKSDIAAIVSDKDIYTTKTTKQLVQIYNSAKCKVDTAHNKLFIDCGKLFAGINIGRLIDKISEANVDSVNKLYYLFDDLLKNIRLEIVHKSQKNSNIYRLLMKLRRIRIR